MKIASRGAMLVGVLFILLTILSCDAPVSLSSRGALQNYLSNYLHGNFDQAYEFLSAKDQASISQDQFGGRYRDDVLAEMLRKRIQYRIRDFHVSGESAEALVEVSVPDFKTIYADFHSGEFAIAGSRDDRVHLERQLNDRYEGSLPRVEEERKFFLIEENDEWRILLNPRVEKKLHAHLQQAAQLRYERKFHAALEEYNSALRLRADSVEAAIARVRVLREIQRYQEEQKYVTQIAVTEVESSKGRRFGLGKRMRGFSGGLVNQGGETLKKIEITVDFLDRVGKSVGRQSYNPVWNNEYSFGEDKKPLEPGVKKEFQYFVEDEVPEEWSGKILIRVTDVEFL